MQPQLLKALAGSKVRPQSHRLLLALPGGIKGAALKPTETACYWLTPQACISVTLSACVSYRSFIALMGVPPLHHSVGPKDSPQQLVAAPERGEGQRRFTETPAWLHGGSLHPYQVLRGWRVLAPCLNHLST